MMDQTTWSILNQADTRPDLALIGKLVKLQELIVESDYQTIIIKCPRLGTWN